MRYFKKNEYKPMSPSEQNTYYYYYEIKLTYFIFFSVYDVVKHSRKLEAFIKVWDC